MNATTPDKTTQTMTVYGADRRIKGEYETLAIFSTRENAEAFIAAHQAADRAVDPRNVDPDRWEIMAFIIDKPDLWVMPTKTTN